jgi:hypothetical protein
MTVREIRCTHRTSNATNRYTGCSAPEVAQSLIAVICVTAAIAFWWVGLKADELLFTLLIHGQEIVVTLPLFLFVVGVAVALFTLLQWTIRFGRLTGQTPNTNSPDHSVTPTPDSGAP